MRPIFSVVADGVDLTAQLADRLLSLMVSDEAGVVSDRIDLALDNRDAAVAPPPTGAVLSVAMGYAGHSLVDVGRYTVDEVETAGMPRTMSLRGKAADMKASLKSWKKRDWHQVTLGKVVRDVAAEHALAPRVAARFEALPIDHLDQSYESDLNLLTRLADQHGAIMKPAGGCLLFTERGAGVDADGQPFPAVLIERPQVVHWQAAQRDRQFYARVGAHWTDKRGATKRYLFAGEGDPVMYLRHPYRSEADALAAAEAKLRSLRRGRTSLSVECVGNPLLCAEMPVVLAGLDPLADGEWIVTRAEHAISGGGMTTRIEAQRRADFAADANPAAGS